MENLRSRAKLDPKVFIIILAYNSETVIRACLQAVLRIKYPNYQIIVVDNLSRDQTNEVIKEFGDQVTVIENQENLGFSAGNNVGLRYALGWDADYLMLLNPDTQATPDLLAILVATGEKDGQIGILSPKALYPGQDRRVIYAGGVFDWSMAKNYHRGQGEVDRGQYDQVGETGFASGAALLVKRKVIEKIGLLDEHYFLYYEDADWCVRAKRAGYKIIYQPKAVVYHQESTATKKGSPDYYYYFTRNRLYFVQKFFPLTTAAKIYFLESLRLIKNLLKLFKESERKQPLAILAGIFDFSSGQMGKRGKVA